MNHEMKTQLTKLWKQRLGSYEMWLLAADDREAARDMTRTFEAWCRMIVERDVTVLDCVNFLGHAVAKLAGDMAEDGDVDPESQGKVVAALRSSIAAHRLLGATYAAMHGDEAWEKFDAESEQRLSDKFETLGGAQVLDRFGLALLAEVTATSLYLRHEDIDPDDDWDTTTGHLVFGAVLFASSAALVGLCEDMARILLNSPAYARCVAERVN